MPSSSILRALTWRRKTPTAMAERPMSAVGMKTASERLRQRSASSPVSSRASGGARVHARVEEGDNDHGKCEFIGTGATLCYYPGAPGDSHLRNAWPVCGSLGFVPRPTHAWIVGRLFLLLRILCGGMSIENGLYGCLYIFC